jgi:Icc-related predicted phosphoesterase
MRAWVLSDLNLSRYAQRQPFSIPDADVCVCAGNVTPGNLVRGVKLLGDRVCPYMPVVLVPGNADFFGSSIYEDSLAAAEQAEAFSDLYLLMGTSALVGGIEFFGDTLWSDFALSGDLKGSVRAATEQLTDYKRIKLRRQPIQRFNPKVARKFHENARRTIEVFLCSRSPFPKVIVTHYAPSARSVPEEWRRDHVASSMASNLEHLIERYRPAAWVHGHVHNSCDYWIGETRILCNPKGVVFDAAMSGFRADLVVTLKDNFNDLQPDPQNGTQSVGAVKSVQQTREVDTIIRV